MSVWEHCGDGVDRRSFLGLAAAAAAIGLPNARGRMCSAGLGEEQMRFGALADIHITGAEQLPYFEKALRRLDAWKVDAVLGCGDLTDFGLVQQLRMVADVWFKVFPNGRGSDGRVVENLLHYGDHDMATWFVDHPLAKAQWPDEVVRRAGLIFENDRKAIWEACFKEPWAPIVLKTVKGYQFILSHFTRGEQGNLNGDNVPGLAEFLRSHAFDPNKPFFYSQHRLPRNTACGSLIVGQDDGSVTRLLSHYPNAIAFSGHVHMTGSCEKSIWQGAFTSVQVPSLRYVVTFPGRENGYSFLDRPPRPPVQTMPQYPSQQMGIHQGFLCVVHENALVIRRWEFEHDRALGPDWVIPFDCFALNPEQRPFDFSVRKKSFPLPEFSFGAKISVSRVRAENRLHQMRDMIRVSFPPVCPTVDGIRADDYEITLELQDFEVVKILSQHRVYSPRYTHPAELDTEDVVCFIDADEFPSENRQLRLVVRPVNVFGGKGRAIVLDSVNERLLKEG